MATKKKRKRRGHRASDARPPRRAESTPAGGPWLVNALFAIIIMAGLAYLAWPSGTGSPDADPTPARAPRSADPRRTPPEPTITTDETGARVARFDPAVLAAWCRTLGLPELPDLGRIEGRIADTLYEALRKVAQTRSADNLGRLGQIYESLDCHDVADAYFKLAEQADPKAFRWPYYRGCIHQLLGRNERAIATFTAAEALQPNYPVLHARLGHLYLEAGDLPRAQARFSKYAQLKPEDSLGYVGLGRVALEKGKNNETLRYLRQAVQRGPGDFQSHFYLATVLARIGARTEARTHFEIATRLPQGKWFFMRDPLDQALHQAAGSTQGLVTYFEQLLQSNDYAGLAKIAEEILAYRPTDTMMMANLASIYRKQKRYDEAHAMLDRAAELQPDLMKIAIVRAAIYLAESLFADAIASANQALAVDKTDMESLNIRGRALLLSGRAREAEADLQRVVDADPNDVGKVYVLGEVHRALGQTEEAKAAYHRALDLNPTFTPAQNRLDELEQ
ncbi:MAG: tetratricopeptide repeat protein [Phycisphaerae bacterium]